MFVNNTRVFYHFHSHLYNLLTLYQCCVKIERMILFISFQLLCLINSNPSSIQIFSLYFHQKQYIQGPNEYKYFLFIIISKFYLYNIPYNFISQMSEHNKIFPLKLPANFHGVHKDKPKPTMAYKNKLDQWQNPQIGNTRVTNWERKRFISDIVRQRKQFIVHPAKISEDTPNWFQSTHNYFRRNEIPHKIKTRTNDQRIFDVFNRQRANMYKIHGDNFTRSQILDRKYSVTDKVGRQQSAQKKFGSLQQVSPKVGSLENRNFDIKKPLLKIGKSGFVDTYTPF